MQQNSDPRRRLYEAALAAPVFSSDAGECWALLPRGASRRRPVLLASKTYQNWLCAMSEEKLGLFPNPTLVASTVQARQRDAAHSDTGSEQVALRIHRSLNGGVYFNLCWGSGECLRIASDGWAVEDPPDHLHFRDPETRLPIPKPIYTNIPLHSYLAHSFGEHNAGVLSKWMIGAVCQKEPAGALLITGPLRHQAAQALTMLLDPRHSIAQEPSYDDDWLLLFAESSRLKGTRLDRLTFHSMHHLRPVVITAANAVTGLDATTIEVTSFAPVNIPAVLGALATDVSAAIRAPQAASLSPSQL